MREKLISEIMEIVNECSEMQLVHVNAFMRRVYKKKRPE